MRGIRQTACSVSTLGPWLWQIAICAAGVVPGCGADAAADDNFVLPTADVVASPDAAALGDTADADAGALAADGGATGDGSDGGRASDATDAMTADAAGARGDSGEDAAPLPTNTAPTFAPPTPLTLAQGAATTIDLGLLLDDGEDEDGALKLSWSAKLVALQDADDHKLYVVAPTTWHGVESVEITVTDSGGLSASAILAVTVTKVTLPDPRDPPPQLCGAHTFVFAAGPGTKSVLLSGSFNGWGATADKADMMLDADGDGTFAVTRALTPGSHSYKFIVDGNWKADPANPKTVPDGYGGVNSVVEVAPCAP